MQSTMLVGVAGRRRSPATLPGLHQGRPPRDKGQHYPADPPTVEEIIAVMRAAGDDADGVRLRGLIVVLWRAGLRISEALALAESALDANRGAILVRHGKGGKRREVGMDRWAWEQLGRGSRCVPRSRSARCSASCAVRPADGRGRRLASAPDCITQPLVLGCDGGSRRISCATRMLWRCRARASCCWSSSASSDMATSRSPPCTCAESTTPRSSTPSTSDQPR